MAQDIVPDAFDILRRDVTAAVQEGVGARGEGEIDRCAWRRAVADQAVELQIIRGGFARRPNHIDDIILHPIIDVDVVNDIARGNDLRRIDHSRHVQVRRGSRHQIEDGAFLRFPGVADI